MASSTQNNYIIPTSWINELPYMDNSPNHPFELQTRLFGSIMTAIEAQNPRSRSAAEYLIVWGSALYGDGWKGIFGQISVVDTTVDQMFGLAQLDWEEASVAVRKICPQGEVKHLRKFWLHFKVVDIFNKHKYWSAVFDAAVVEPAVADAEPEPEDEVTDADMETQKVDFDIWGRPLVYIKHSSEYKIDYLSAPNEDIGVPCLEPSRAGSGAGN